MELHQLRCVVAVVDHGGFTRAARALHLAQPSLSYAIGRLESELGALLFHRIGRRVVLTPAGEAFVEGARRTLREADSTRAAVDDVAALVGGRVDLVSMRSLMGAPLALLVGRFRRAYPRVVVGVHDPEDDGGVLRLVRSGACEIGIARTEVVPGDLRGRQIGTEEFVAAFPPGTEIEAAAVTPADFAEHPLVAPARGTRNRALWDRTFVGVPFDPFTAVETRHVESILELVLAGAGATSTSAASAHVALERGAVIRRFDPPIVSTISVVHRPGPLSPAAAAMLDHVVEHAPEALSPAPARLA